MNSHRYTGEARLRRQKKSDFVYCELWSFVKSEEVLLFIVFASSTLNNNVFAACTIYDFLLMRTKSDFNRCIRNLF